MVARYVIPELQGFIKPLRDSGSFVIDNREVFERAGQAVMAKIMQNDKAAAALQHTGPAASRSPRSTRRTCGMEAAKVKSKALRRARPRARRAASLDHVVGAGEQRGVEQ